MPAQPCERVDVLVSLARSIAALGPAPAAASGGCFPGRIGSPLAGIAGVFLWTRLQAATTLR
jgi:hypothetical protein